MKYIGYALVIFVAGGIGFLIGAQCIFSVLSIRYSGVAKERIASGETHLADGNYWEALEFLHSARSSAPESPEVIALLSKTYEALGCEELSIWYSQQLVPASGEGSTAADFPITTNSTR